MYHAHDRFIPSKLCGERGDLNGLRAKIARETACAAAPFVSLDSFGYDGELCNGDSLGFVAYPSSIEGASAWCYDNTIRVVGLTMAFSLRPHCATGPIHHKYVRTA